MSSLPNRSSISAKDAVGTAHVGDDADGGLAQLGLHLPQPFLAPGHEDHLGALGGEQLGDGSSRTARRAGDRRDLPGQLTHVVFSHRIVGHELAR
jgi:hypothetical protein